MRKQTKGKIHRIALRVDRTGDKDLRVFNKDVSLDVEITQVCIVDHEEDRSFLEPKGGESFKEGVITKQKEYCRACEQLTFRPEILFA